jgi:lipopolysaccharide transport system ATP-binding protein
MGAGKARSLSRVTPPTTGSATVRGRAGSLLEVGTGFHPELTGRENTYLNGAVLGMSKAEINAKFDAIVAFAELERFLDTPVKRYSTGMYMRLAFAVAAHLEPDILFVDEVLAVGDAAFQKKCLGAMERVARQGRTVLFVSHNMAAVQSLCSRLLWLHQGRVVADGRPAAVIGDYLRTITSRGLQEQTWTQRDLAPGDDRVRLRRVAVRPEPPSQTITMHTPVEMEFEYWNLVDGANLEIHIELINDQGIVAFESSSTPDVLPTGAGILAGLYRSRCLIPADLLITGIYYVVVSIIKDQQHILYRDDGLLSFEVLDAPELRGAWYGEMVGVVRPLLKWTTERIAAVR